MLGNYDIVLAGDLNIDELNSCLDSSNHLPGMKDVFNLSNLIRTNLFQISKWHSFRFNIN